MFYVFYTTQFGVFGIPCNTKSFAEKIHHTIYLGWKERGIKELGYTEVRTTEDAFISDMFDRYKPTYVFIAHRA